VLGPPAVLDRLVQRRQARLRRAVPDALDLLVVCVEAGVSLDAAVLRVARDLGVTHPELAGELAMVNRKVNAGMPREQALQGLWTRTGLEELRGLVASMVQSERWGTSIAKVLRVNAETLRRVRKQTAEKKAAQASLKMMGPMVLFMLPALFIVLLGPAFMRISEAFASADNERFIPEARARAHVACGHSVRPCVPLEPAAAPAAGPAWCDDGAGRHRSRAHARARGTGHRRVLLAGRRHPVADGSRCCRSRGCPRSAALPDQRRDDVGSIRAGCREPERGVR
jgi:hypothetical protein